jgi:hypothetical protein
MKICKVSAASRSPSPQTALSDILSTSSISLPTKALNEFVTVTSHSADTVVKQLIILSTGLTRVENIALSKRFMSNRSLECLK